MTVLEWLLDSDPAICWQVLRDAPRGSGGARPLPLGARRAPFFNGEVEPCINDRTVMLGIYFEQDVAGVVARLLGELEDGGWNCEVENGSVRSSFATTINVLEVLLAHERATGGSAESRAARRRVDEYAYP